jgi:hypothetical protein
MTYTNEAKVEAYLGETFDGTTVPTSTDIAIFVGWADKAINDYTGTAFESTTVTDEILDSEGLQRFKLPKNPLISVTSFSVDTGGLGATTNWDVRTEGRTASENFVILESEGVLHFHTEIPSAGIQNIKTTYAYGYDTVPADVEKLATLLVVRDIVRARLADNTFSAQDSITVGPIRIQKSGQSASQGVVELNSEIDDMWKAVGKFKNYLH